MLEVPTYVKDMDVSYMDDDGALQLANTQTFAIRRLQERMELRLQRGKQFNLPYDLGKAGLIHIWSLYSIWRPADASSQPALIENRVIKPSASTRHLGVHIDDTLAFHAHTDVAASKGYK